MSYRYVDDSGMMISASGLTGHVHPTIISPRLPKSFHSMINCRFFFFQWKCFFNSNWLMIICQSLAQSSDMWPRKIKKSQQCLFRLRKLAKFQVDRSLMTMFYRSFIESVVTFSFICWFASLNLKHKNSITRITKVSSKIIGSLYINHDQSIMSFIPSAISLLCTTYVASSRFISYSSIRFYLFMILFTYDWFYVTVVLCVSTLMLSLLLFVVFIATVEESIAPWG